MNEISYLYSLQQFGIKLGLSNIKELCAILNNPQDKIKSVHVGGTNGKGSTAAILSSILREAGYKVGLYTSPHLTDFTERIRINNIPISEDKALFLTRYIRERIGDKDITPTFFEFTTALALYYFAEECVDIAIMEVGMGGRLDATNIIAPLISIVTNIEYDHTEHLGKSLEEIAGEKCGIIKRGVPVISSETKPGIFSIIENSAKEAGSPAYGYGRDFVVESLELDQYHSRFYYSGLNYRRLLLETLLLGRHQMFNLGTALYATELLTGMGFDVSGQHKENGVHDVTWPGRLETLPGNPSVLLDGAHNHAASIVLREFIEDVVKKDSREKKIVLIFGALKDKDVKSMLQELIPCVSEIILTRPDTDRGFQVEELKKITEKFGREPYMAKSVAEALTIAYNITSASDMIVITGSLYLVGEARTLLSRGLVSG